MGHEGRTLRWETKVGARRTDFINESIFVKRHLCKSYKPQFKLKESKMIKSCRKNDLFLATVYINLRSSAEVFCKKSVLKNFAHWKTPVLESPFIKVAGFAGSATLLKGDSNIGVFL